MGAPLGNNNAGKAKIWEQAIKRALARRIKGSVDDGLNDLADKLVEAAAAGDPWALKEIGDRLDGKPVQGIAGPNGEPFTLIIQRDDAKAL